MSFLRQWLEIIEDPYDLYRTMPKVPEPWDPVEQPYSPPEDYETYALAAGDDE